jgi:membrane protein
MPIGVLGLLRKAADRAWSFVATLFGGLVRSRTIDLAAEMAFWLFFSLVPLAAVASFVGARYAKEHTSLFETWLSVLPQEARSFVTTQVAHVAAWRGGTAPAAVATFVWLASNGVHSVLEAIEVQTGVTRPWWRKRLLALGVCLALSISAAALALLAVGLARVETAAGHSWPGSLVTIEWSGVGRAIRSALGLALALGMTAGLYRLAIPRRARTHAKVLPGAAVAVALQVVLGWCYALYISRFGSAAAYSGGAYQAGLAAVGVTMTTLWLLSIALLVGVELNAMLGPSRRSR